MRARIQDIHDAPGPERALTGYPASATTDILNAPCGGGGGAREAPGFDITVHRLAQPTRDHRGREIAAISDLPELHKYRGNFLHSGSLLVGRHP